MYNRSPATKQIPLYPESSETIRSHHPRGFFPFDLCGRMWLHPTAPPAPGKGQHLELEIGDLVGGNLGGSGHQRLPFPTALPGAGDSSRTTICLQGVCTLEHGMGMDVLRNARPGLGLWAGVRAGREMCFRDQSPSQSLLTSGGPWEDARGADRLAPSRCATG